MSASSSVSALPRKIVRPIVLSSWISVTDDGSMDRSSQPSTDSPRRKERVAVPSAVLMRATEPSGPDVTPSRTNCGPESVDFSTSDCGSSSISTGRRVGAKSGRSMKSRTSDDLTVANGFGFWRSDDEVLSSGQAEASKARVKTSVILYGFIALPPSIARWIRDQRAACPGLWRPHHPASGGPRFCR